MRLISMLVVVGLALNTAALSADGQGRGNGHANKPTTQTTNSHADTPKAKTQTNGHSTKTETRTVKAETHAAKVEHKSAKTTSTTTTVATSDVTPTTPTTRTIKNPKLEARLKTMLPADTNMQDAMAGFKNMGQFIAAVHVSNNLGIPFADLKAKMTGLTPGPTPGTTIQGPKMSLGQAIQSWKGEHTTPPTEGGSLTTTRIRSEVKKAEDAAGEDLRRTREGN